MSILVKGMKMPLTCNDCALQTDYGTCGFYSLYVEGGHEAEIQKRRDDCPLVELPRHDRLNNAYIKGFDDGVYYITHCGDETPVTNADLIRQMTDKELADWLASVEVRILDEQPIIGLLQMRDAWLDWLKQECE